MKSKTNNHDPPQPILDRVKRQLAKGFIVLSFNPTSPVESRFEAWAYEGPLDFDAAAPVRFGIGADPFDALIALEYQLSHSQKPRSRPRQCHARNDQRSQVLRSKLTK